MTTQHQTRTGSGVAAGLNSATQIWLVLAEIERRGGSAAMKDLYEPVERNMGGVKLSREGQGYVRYLVNRIAVNDGLVHPHDPKHPGWRITPKGRAHLQNSPSSTPTGMRLVPLNGRLTLPTRLWFAPEPSGPPELSFSLDRPNDRAAYYVEDLKEWALGKNPERPLSDGGPRRAVRSDQVLHAFLDQVIDAAPPRALLAMRELCFLLPSTEPEFIRKYRHMLARAAGDLWSSASTRFLRDTEMIFEYARLVRGQLAAEDEEAPGLYIIIDCGARFCTFTAVVSAIKDDVRGPRWVLRAMPGVTIKQAGLTIDDALLVDARTGLGFAKNDATLTRRAAEFAKIQVSRTDKPFTLHGPDNRAWNLRPQRLRSLSGGLVGSFNAPLAELIVNANTLAETTSSPHPQIRGVILAGGSSQLPGFADAVRKLLKLGNEVPMPSLGEQAPIAAAAGAMAHILHRQGRLIPPAGASLADAEFFPSLLDDIHLVSHGDEPTTQSRILVERDRWPVAYLSDEAGTVAPPAWAKKIAKITLGWGPDAAAHEDFLTSDGPSPWFEIDCQRRLPEIRLMALHGGTQLKLYTDGDPPDSRLFNTAPSTTSRNLVRPPGSPSELAYAHRGDTLVVDLGAAKTVLLASDASGVVDPQSFASPDMPVPPELPDGYRWDVDLELDDAEAEVEAEAEAEAPDLAEDLPTEPPVPGPPPPPRLERSLRPAEPTEAEFLADARDLAQAFGLDIPADVLAAVHLAATTRPFVLLAGPPGLGKTTLAHFYAGLLGCAVDDQTLAWISIQAHWISDKALFKRPRGPISRLCDLGAAYPDLVQSVLFDEFNLARPEYYLTRYFSALESHVAFDHADGRLHLPRTDDGHPRVLTFATLNIDESSRPPSDKILDRAFLIEPAELQRKAKLRRSAVQPPTFRLSAETWSRWRRSSEELDDPPEFRQVLEIFDSHARSHPAIIHESLSPSRRAIHDVCVFMHRYEELGESALLGMTRAQALDRAISGRILPRLRGEVSHLKELLESLAKLSREQQWTGSLRHIEAMQRRVEFGFVSFWG